MFAQQVPLITFPFWASYAWTLVTFGTYTVYIVVTLHVTIIILDEFPDEFQERQEMIRNWKYVLARFNKFMIILFG